MYCSFVLNLREIVLAISDLIKISDTLIGSHVSIEAIVAVPALIIAILIPFAILLIDSRDSTLKWDKSVILKQVLGIRTLFISFLILLIAPIFWDTIPKILTIFLISFAVAAFLKVMVNSYHWIKVVEMGESQNQTLSTFRSKKRVDFLNSLSDEQQIVIWSQTWSNKNSRGFVDERTLIDVFVKNLYRLSEKDEKLTSNIITEFTKNLSKIDLYDPIIHEHILKFSLQWAKTSYPSGSLRLVVRNLFFQILKFDLKSPWGPSLLFTDIREYIKENEIDESKFIEVFAPEFLSQLDNLGEGLRIENIFDDFPEDWQITYEKLKAGEKSSISWLGAYLRWIVDKDILVDTANYKYSNLIDTITEKILPKIDTFSWSDLVAFHLSAYWVGKNENREHAQIMNYLEKEKIFGKLGRSYISWENSDDDYVVQRTEELNETLNIVKNTKFFPRLNNIEKLDRYIAELNRFDLKDSEKKTRLDRLKSLFLAIKNLDDNAI